MPAVAAGSLAVAAGSLAGSLAGSPAAPVGSPASAAGSLAAVALAVLAGRPEAVAVVRGVGFALGSAAVAVPARDLGAADPRFLASLSPLMTSMSFLL